MDNIKFFIAGIQRTGTTYIRTMLNSHRDIRCIGEAFLPAKEGEEYYYTYKNKGLKRKLWHIFFKKKLICEYLDYIYSKKRYKAIGFKLMLNQSMKHRAIKKYLETKQIRGLIVIRKNVLKTYVSRETAKARKVFHSQDALSAYQVTLNPEKMMRSLHVIEKDNQAILATFQPLEHMFFTYEDFVMNRGNLHTNILEYIGVNSNVQLTSPLKKLNPDRLQEIVTNYDQVSRRLLDSPFAYCLQQGSE
jgi:hypothetical protein